MLGGLVGLGILSVAPPVTRGYKPGQDHAEHQGGEAERIVKEMLKKLLSVK